MVQSPSWEANWFPASQEISRISRNPKVHYLTHKRPSPVSILGQPNPVHIPTFLVLEIRPNIIHTSTPRSPQWSPSLRFPHQDPIHPPLLTHTRHMPSPSHSSRWVKWATTCYIMLSLAYTTNPPEYSLLTDKIEIINQAWMRQGRERVLTTWNMNEVDSEIEPRGGYERK